MRRISRFLPPVARAAGAAALDYRFDHRSPLPTLDGRAVDALASAEELVFPPSIWAAPGNQSYSGLGFLVELSRFIGARRIFEIGTYNGATAWCLARNLEDAEVHTLDLPPQQDPALKFEVTDTYNRIPFEHRAYEALPLSTGRVVQHWGDSATFDFAPWRGSIDLVYVDGAHSPEYVRADSATALGLVRKSGAIVWDDYWRRIHGVQTILEELPVHLCRVPGTRLVVHLPPALLQRLQEV
jgi:predicted O-methyltransferase YrrM